MLNDPSLCLKNLIYIKPVTKSTMELAHIKGIKLYSFEQVEQIGATNVHIVVVSISFSYDYTEIFKNVIDFSRILKIFSRILVQFY